MPLLERDTQLASLAAYAREAQQGDGRLVLIAGEAGVGKSALVEQLERGLPEASWHWGGCDGLFTPRPLGPLFDIASQLGGELLELCRADAPREELFSALLRQVSAPGRLHVLVVEDAHWADEATIDMLRFLAGGSGISRSCSWRPTGTRACVPRIRCGSCLATWLRGGASGASASRRSLRARWRCWPTGAALIPLRCTG